MKLKRLIALASLLLMLAAVAPPAIAQCPLCKNSVESTLKNNPDGRKTGKGLNAGIMVLFFMPYTAALVVGFLWYRNTRRTRKRASRLHE